MCTSMKQKGLCGQRYIGIRSWREHTLAYSMHWLFWQTAEPGLIKCSDKNQSFIKVCSHSGCARPRSWNVSWKLASRAQECCLSYLIKRSCCARECEREHERTRRGGGGGGGGKAGSSPSASRPKTCSEPTGPQGFAPYINPEHVGGKAHRSFQESKQGQMLSRHLLSPSSASPVLFPACCSTANSLPYFRQDLLFSLSLLCRLALCQISELIKRGTDGQGLLFFFFFFVQWWAVGRVSELPGVGTVEKRVGTI